MMAIQKEVDFHHQIAYRFEKSARLRAKKKGEDTVNAANKEIILLIENQIWIVEIDPMIVFYCLYFVVYYNNEPIYQYIKKLIHRLGLTNHDFGRINRRDTNKKMYVSGMKHGLDRTEQINKIDDLFDRIELHTIKKLTDTSQVMCQEFFHKVLYQSVEDNLRLIYDKIIGKLKEVNLRDQDALHFIR